MFEIGSWKRYAREDLETFRILTSAFVFYLAALSKLRRVPKNHGQIPQRF